MPFDIRCPDCRSKLRLDEKPARDLGIECPKCGGTFTPAEAAAADKAAGGPPPAAKGKDKAAKKPAAPQEAKAGAPTSDKPQREAKERTFFNPFALLAIIAAVLLMYVGVCWFVLNQLGKSGKVEDMVAFIPKECNIVRGASLTILNKYPGYKSELEKYATPPVQAAMDELARTAGHPPEVFHEYMVYGRSNAGGPEMTVFAFRSGEDLNPATVRDGLKASDDARGGAPCLRVPAGAPGLLSGALLDFPTKRHVVVIPRTGNADQGRTLAASRAAAADHAQSFVAELGDTGRVAIRGHGWVLMRPAGVWKQVLDVLAELLKKDMPAFSESLKTTKLIGMWNSFGGSVRFGGAMDCASSSTASTVAKSLRDGAMGQGDDVETPRSFKTAFQGSNNKEFGAMKSHLKFQSSGTCAYYTSSLEGEQAKRMLDVIELPKKLDGGSTATPGQ